MRKLWTFLVTVTLLMLAHIASASACGTGGSSTMYKHCDKFYRADWASGKFGNGGAWDPRGWNGGQRMYGGYGHPMMRRPVMRPYGYGQRRLVAPPYAVRALPQRRFAYGAVVPVGVAVGYAGGYAVGGAPNIPAPVGVSVVPINPPRSAAVTVPSAQPSAEAILEAQRAAGKVLRISNECAAGWTRTVRSTCARVVFDTVTDAPVAAAAPTCEPGWTLTERGTCAQVVED